MKPDGFTFAVLVARLLERLTSLVGRYGAVRAPFDIGELTRAAAHVRVVDGALGWRELFRASGRHQRMLPMSGLMGSLVVQGDLRPFLPWLVWGTFTQVGKDAAMGNGMFRLEPA